MQAITTKYIGPANVKGSRVKASAAAGSLTLEWDDRLNSDNNHKRAAEAFARKFNWTGTWVCGHLPDGAVVWVSADSNFAADSFTIKEEVAA